MIAGLSAGGFGAIDIALRHPELFGAAESWSGYFMPFHDGPFKGADARRSSPRTIRRSSSERERVRRRGSGLRFFVSSGPSHSHWFREAATVSFAHELRATRPTGRAAAVPDVRGEWRGQLDAGLGWVFPRR